MDIYHTLSLREGKRLHGDLFRLPRRLNSFKGDEEKIVAALGVSYVFSDIEGRKRDYNHFLTD